MNKNLLYYYFVRGYLIRLKNNIRYKRNYIYLESTEKYDFVFDDYKNKIIKKMLETSELKRRFSRKMFIKKVSRNRFFKKIYIRTLAAKIKNELLLTIPNLLFFHKKAKSWKIIKSKQKRRSKRFFFNRRKKLIKNVKTLKVGRDLTYRESFDLRIRLNKLYFWLVNTTKRQILVVKKFNRLKQTYDRQKVYLTAKRSYFSKRLYIKKKSLYKFFLRKKLLYISILKKKFNNFYKKLIIFLNLLTVNKFFFKFYFLKSMLLYSYLLKKTIVYKSVISSLSLSLKELKPVNKRFKIRRRVRRKLIFAYKLLKYRKKIFRLKVRMVSSNFFITLTDFNDKVVISRSTGQVSDSRKKKVKLSPYLVTRMMYAILRKLRRLRIKYLYFFINTKINRHINNVMKALKNFRYTKILKIFFSKPIAHHFGTRKPKLRRL